MAIKCYSLDAVGEDQVRPSSRRESELTLVYPYHTISLAVHLDHSLQTQPWFCSVHTSLVCCLFSWVSIIFLLLVFEESLSFGLAFSTAARQLWAFSQVTVSFCHEIDTEKRKRKWKFSPFMSVHPHGTHTALWSCTQMSQDFHPKGLLEVPEITLDHSVRPGGIHLFTLGSALLSSGWLSWWGQAGCSLCCWPRWHSILFHYEGRGGGGLDFSGGW